MGIGRMTIILRHTWLVEHNSEIDWSTGKVSMTRCLAACVPNATADDINQLKFSSADYLAGCPSAKAFQKIHIEAA